MKNRRDMSKGNQNGSKQTIISGRWWWIRSRQQPRNYLETAVTCRQKDQEGSKRDRNSRDKKESKIQTHRHTHRDGGERERERERERTLVVGTLRVLLIRTLRSLPIGTLHSRFLLLSPD
jgi:hypothetical protein